MCPPEIVSNDTVERPRQLPPPQESESMEQRKARFVVAEYEPQQRVDLERRRVSQRLGQQIGAEPPLSQRLVNVDAQFCSLGVCRAPVKRGKAEPGCDATRVLDDPKGPVIRRVFLEPVHTALDRNGLGIGRHDPRRNRGVVDFHDLWKVASSCRPMDRWLSHAQRRNSVLASQGRAVHGPRAPKASSSLMTFARSLTSTGTHAGNGTSLFTWRPETVCTCCTCATRFFGNRLATRTSAGQSRR